MLGIYLNIYGKKNRSFSLFVSLQLIYMHIQRMFAPKISGIPDNDKLMMEV